VPPVEPPLKCVMSCHGSHVCHVMSSYLI